MHDHYVDQSYLKGLEGVTFDPVFILGLHRSGTSILYKTLTTTGCFNPITAYHLIRYHELLRNAFTHTEDQAKADLTALFRASGLKDRGIDRLAIDADFPEEYGFLLGHRTLLMSLSSRNLPLFNQLGQKIQVLAHNQKPLLAKNPFDFPNFLYLKRAFPSARFVFIHRHPLKTLSSTLKAWQDIIREKNPYTLQLARFYDQYTDNPLLSIPLRTVFLDAPELGAVLLTIMASRATRYYLRNIDRLPPTDYVSVTYEQFCRQPQETIDLIMRSLGQPASVVDAARLVSPRRVTVDPVIQKLSPYIMRAMRLYCTAFGYTTTVTD